MLLSTLHANTELAQEAIRTLVPRLARAERTCACDAALATAFITQRGRIPAQAKEKLALIAGRYLE